MIGRGSRSQCLGQTRRGIGSHQAMRADEAKADGEEVHHAANEEAIGTHGGGW